MDDHPPSTAIYSYDPRGNVPILSDENNSYTYTKYDAIDRAIAVRIFRTLRCEGMARVDFFYEEGTPQRPGRGFLLNEVNTIPGFTPISMYPKLWIASGLSYSALIDELVLLAVERQGRQRRNTKH